MPTNDRSGQPRGRKDRRAKGRRPALRPRDTGLDHTHRQLAALHELGKRLADALDPHEALLAAARAVPDLIGARGAAVVSFDARTQRPGLAFTWGLSEQAAARLRDAVEGALQGEACRTCQPLTARLNQRCPLLSPLGELAQREGVESVVCLPVVLQNRRLAVIGAYLGPGQTPGDGHVRALNLLAAQLAPALEGARLRSRLLEALYAAGQLSARLPDMDPWLARALQGAAQAWQADAGAVLLLEGGTWSVRARHNLGDLLQDEVEPLLDLARQAAERGQPVIESPPGGTFRSMASAPLQAEQRVLGALVLASRQQHGFAPHHLPILGALANQMALAVRNAQLSRRLHEMALVEERYRLSRELHDGLAQTLGFLGLQVDHIRRLLAEGRPAEAGRALDELARVVREAYQDVREAIDGLRASALPDASLDGALRRLADAFAARADLEVQVSVRPAPGHTEVRVSPEAQLQLLRIAHEALTNVRKHARARRVEVSLQEASGWLELTVADDGRGFDPGDHGTGHRLGLASMHERARSLGGQLTVMTGLGLGTRVTVRVPLEPTTARFPSPGRRPLPDPLPGAGPPPSTGQEPLEPERAGTGGAAAP